MDIFRPDVADIVAARLKGQILHGTLDIDTAGDEVEQAVRNVLERRLPKRCHVGHGHIVDAGWQVSPQLDVIVSDATTLPVLLAAQDGTEYTPYESVLAFGEIKSTYDPDKRPVANFVDTICQLKTDFRREPVDVRYSGRTIKVNPLFTFQFFVNSEKVAEERVAADLDKLFASTDKAHLPNMICILDKGNVFAARGQRSATGNDVLRERILYPEFEAAEPDAPPFVWAFVRSRLLATGLETDVRVTTLALLYLDLLDHIAPVTLRPPDMRNYLIGMNSGFDGWHISSGTTSESGSG